MEFAPVKYNSIMSPSLIGADTMLKVLLKRVLLVLLLGQIFSVYGQGLNIKEMRIQSPAAGNCGAHALDDSQWPGISLANLPQNQHFCLRTSLTIAAGEFENATSVSLSMLGSSRIYWDGQLIGENGIVGVDKMTEDPGVIDYLLPLSAELLTAGEHKLAIEVSTFHIDEDLPTIFYGFRIIDTKQINQYLLQSARAAIFIISALLVFSLLFQLLFWLYQGQIVYQVFSILCLSSALLLLAEKWRAMFGFTYDFQLTRLHWILAFTYLCCLLLPVFYLIYYQIKNKAIWISLTALVLFFLLFLGDDYDDKGILLFFSSLLVTLGVNLFALKQRKSSALLNTVIVLSGICLFIGSPTDFTEDRFTITFFAIIFVMLVSLILEMKSNRLQSLASIRLEAELLKRNLQPHFLMNSLMLVIEWIEEKPQEAANFVQALAEELRMLVKFSDLREVELAEEIILCRRHLQIMSYRYKADYRLEVKGDIKGIMIPPAIIHTQIENAFTHNHVPVDAVFTLSVTQDDSSVELSLMSPLNKKIQSSSMGIGERYIRSRLIENYGNHFCYSSYPHEKHWINTINIEAAN
jgi:sensor histidine kinase YesM